MSSRFDGSALLAAIAGNPTVFPALRGEIDLVARKMLLKQLKSATFNFDLMSRVLSAIGEPSVRTGLDEMSTKEVGSLARRLDPANAGLASMSEAQLGDHICALGRGDVTPLPGKKVVPVRSPAKRPKKELSKIGEVLNSKVHSGEPPEPSATKPASKKASQRKV